MFERKRKYSNPFLWSKKSFHECCTFQGLPQDSFLKTAVGANWKFFPKAVSFTSSLCVSFLLYLEHSVLPACPSFLFAIELCRILCPYYLPRRSSPNLNCFPSLFPPLCACLLSAHQPDWNCPFSGLVLPLGSEGLRLTSDYVLSRACWMNDTCLSGVFWHCNRLY